MGATAAGEGALGGLARKPEVFRITLAIPAVFLEGAESAGQSLPNAPLCGHHALASLADKTAFCAPIHKWRKTAFAVREQGPWPGLPGGPPPFSCPVETMSSKGQLQLMVATWELGPDL